MGDDDECSSKYPLDKKGTNHFLDPVKYEQARRWVLESYDDIDEWKEKHKIYTEGCTSGGQRRRENITSEKPLQFIPWLRRQMPQKKLTRDVDAYEDPLVFKGTTHEGSFDLALAGEDEYDVPTYMKGKVLARAQRLWCDRNSKYRKFNYDPYPNDEVRKIKCPKRVRPEDWERFLELHREPRVIARRERGKAARKAMKRPDTSGRRGSGRTAERLWKKNPKVPIFRTDVYLATHTKADGSSLTPELDVELEKIRNICIVEPETVSLDIDNDPVAQEKTARFTLEEDLAHVKDKLTTMDEKLSSLAARRQGTSGSATFNATESPSSMCPSSPIALLGKERPCELLSFTGKIVACWRAIGDSHSAVYNIIIGDVTYNPNIHSVDSDPSLSSLNDVELGKTIVWAKMLTRFFN
ncbi:hypothetical protein GIB67_008789 [Kingdonia uniflora]|uniref:Transposase n=1 Tax=Kingdonia uniflora TaxID=39325 RepID=A0A7J7P6H3_9MAGN|nr:hypothetical protein GIB67_008789 [Kingdonia uniflora]